MTTTQEALKMAIEAFTELANEFMPDISWVGTSIFIKTETTINACKEALEQSAKQLSDDEIWEIVNKTHLGLSPFEDTFRFARAIEAKIRGE